MVMNEEEIFPRGGKKIAVGVKRKEENDSLFPTEKRRKIQKGKSTVTNVEDTLSVSLNSKGSLTRAILHEDMIVLACIRKITEHALELDLPGFLSAKVTIDSISEVLNKKLKEALQSSDISSLTDILHQIFKKGSYVPFKVKKIQNEGDKTEIFGSISPSDINSGRRHNSFNKEELLWAAVILELDHGYQLDCGVKNCRIFLPNQNIEDGRELKIGEPIWCKIHKADKENAASTLRVGAKLHHIDTVFMNDDVALNLILPGTKVEVFVEKVLKHGLSCRIFDKYLGFLHESQFNPPMKKLSSFKEASSIFAYVVFVEETTKIVHLTMRNLNSDLEHTYKRGDQVSASVISKAPNGLYFKLNKNDRGWISNRRLLSSKNPNNDKKYDKIGEKYQNGSNHQCVVLSYNYMERVYICGVEKELLKEKYFDCKDFKVGELVQGVIQQIKANGIVLNVGQARGFIPNIHLTDSAYSDNLKKKFSVGKKIKAKVFSASEKNVIFTLKTSFVKSEKYFESLEKAVINEVYPALVLKARPFGLNLIFHNSIEGFVPIREFDIPITEEYKKNPSSFFYSGKVINVRILKNKTEKIIASLQLDASLSKIVEIGSNVKAVVTKVEEKGLNVHLTKNNSNGFVPLEHLSINYSLCSRMLETFKVDDVIPDLLVIKSDDSGTILSRREALGFKRSNLKVPKFQNLKKGAILRCSVESVDKNGIFVSSPIKKFSGNIFVKKKFITEAGDMPDFKTGQSVLGKIMEIDHKKNSISLSLKSDNVFCKNIQSSVSLLAEYLTDEDHLRCFGNENDWPISEYEVGQRVLCLAKEVAMNGCLVELPNKCKGLVIHSLCSGAKEGRNIEGVVLGHNFKLNYVEICLDQGKMKHINLNQDGNLPENEKNFTAHKLISRDEYLLAVLRKNGNEQFVYIPMRTCENDDGSTWKSFYDSEIFRVEICGKIGNRLIAVHKKLKHILDKKIGCSNKVNNKLVSEKVKSEKVVRKRSNVAPETEEEKMEIDEINESEESDEEEIEIGCEDDESEEENENCVEDEESESEIENINEDSDSVDEDDNEMESKTLNGRSIINNELNSSVLPSMSNFFNTQTAKKLEDSSSDDEEKEVKVEKKKKKLTPAQRAQLAKEEEERLNRVEKELADNSREPQNAEQFERLLLAEPNSSALWIKYMAFHLSLAEFERARVIGRKALETINITLVEERFNVWVSLLNLENLFGTKESFETLFEEAIRYNDAFKIYMTVLDMLHESGKTIELVEKVNKARHKFKQEPEMWTRVAKIYYLLGKFNEARNVKNACLKSIINPKQQYNLILKFAILEFNHGEIDIGVSIFENVLDTYPNKSSAWLVYIDQLISKGHIQDARNLLDRAITMSLPLKIIKVICHKYRSFEEKYGTAQSLENFKEKAKKVLQEKSQMV